ncbi:MAG TPA: hypothetical protein VIM34_23720 [Burkholderiaceae bacterium]
MTIAKIKVAVNQIRIAVPAMPVGAMARIGVKAIRTNFSTLVVLLIATQLSASDLVVNIIYIVVHS